MRAAIEAHKIHHQESTGCKPLFDQSKVRPLNNIGVARRTCRMEGATSWVLFAGEVSTLAGAPLRLRGHGAGRGPLCSGRWCGLESLERGATPSNPASAQAKWRLQPL